MANQPNPIQPVEQLTNAELCRALLLKPLPPKLRYDLIHPLMVRGLAEVMTLGDKKHGGHKWLEQPHSWGDHVAAHGRHMDRFLAGEVRCPIDQQLHLNSAAWRLLALSVYQQLGLGHNDLPGWGVYPLEG